MPLPPQAVEQPPPPVIEEPVIFPGVELEQDPNALMSLFIPANAHHWTDCESVAMITICDKYIDAYNVAFTWIAAENSLLAEAHQNSFFFPL